MCWPFFYDLEEGGSQIFFCFSLLKEYGIKTKTKQIFVVHFLLLSRRVIIICSFMLYNKLSFNPPFTPQLYSPTFLFVFD